MLQPQNYPKLIGQALVFEPDPFVVMVDDDNPWLEGLFFTVVIGFIVAVAQIVGGLLLSAVLPNPTAVLETILQAFEQSRPFGLSTTELLVLQDNIRSVWPLFTGFYHYGNGWGRLLLLVTTPLVLVIQWSLYGLLSHLIAKALGGNGSIGQTLGVTALGMAPRVFLVVTGIPFASVGGLMMQVWGILIAYRGLEVAHGFEMRKAVTSALFPVVILILSAVVIAAAVASFIVWVGGS